MPEEAIQDLQQLLAALARERGVRAKIRVIGRAWELMRSLSTSEREQVALRFGSTWAWKQIERTFMADGDLSENERLVGRAFERFGRSDPGELREFARAIREGDHDVTRDALLKSLSEALEEEAEEDEESLVDIDDALEDDGVSSSTADSDLVDTDRGVLASVLAQPAEERPPAKTEARAPDPPPVPSSHATSEFRKAIPARESRAHPNEREDRSRRITRVDPPVRDDPRPTPREKDGGDLGLAPTGGLDGADRLRVLRHLNRDADALAHLDRTGRAELILSLGGGWASRRALSKMIETRALAGLDEALALIESLERPGQRTWCLADLVQHWELTTAQVDEVLALVPSDAARRRLSRRSGLQA